MPFTQSFGNASKTAKQAIERPAGLLEQEKGPDAH